MEKAKQKKNAAENTKKGKSKKATGQNGPPGQKQKKPSGTASTEQPKPSSAVPSEQLKPASPVPSEQPKPTSPVPPEQSKATSPVPSEQSKPTGPVPSEQLKPASPVPSGRSESTEPVPGPSARPLSGRSHRSSRVEPSSDQDGSVVSMRSKVAWSDNAEERTNSVVSKVSQEKSARMAEAEMNEAHAYVPYVFARDSVAKISNDMKNMKANHIHIIAQIEVNYKNIEDETQSQFNMFVTNLEQKYGNKVKTFRQVIQVHRIELQHKQEYWDEALQSLSQRNQKLLREKRKLLIANKREYDQLESDKVTTVRVITDQLTDKDRQISQLKEQLKRKEREYEEDKEKELSEMERILREEWEAEKRELEALRDNTVIHAASVTETQAVRHSSGVTTVDLESVTELERKLQERDATILGMGAVISTKDTELEKEKRAREYEVKRLEHELNKLRKKLNGDIEPESDLEKQVEQLEERVMQLELELKDTAADKNHYMNLNKDQTVYLSDQETRLTSADTRVSHLLVIAAEADISQAELEAVTKQRDDLRNKVKILETEILKKTEELQEHDKKADKLRANMEKDMKKMLKEIAKLRKQVEEMPEPPAEPQKSEQKLHKMEDVIIDLEHKISTLTADREFLSSRTKTQKQRMVDLGEELYKTDKRLAALTVTASTRDVYQTQLVQTQINRDDKNDTINNMEQQLKAKERELRDRDRLHERDFWEEERKQKEITNDIKKLVRQMAKLKKQLKTAEEAANVDADVQAITNKIQTLQDTVISVETERDNLKERNRAKKTRCADLENRLVQAEETAHQLQDTADAQIALMAAQSELDAMKQQIENHRKELFNKQKDVDDKIADLHDRDRKIHSLNLTHEEELRNKERTIIDLENEIKKLQRQIAKLREKLGISDKDTTVTLDKEVDDLEDKVTELKKQIVDIEAEKRLINSERDHLSDTNKELEAMLNRQQVTSEIQQSGSPLAMSTPLPTTDADVQDLTHQIEELQREVDQNEAEFREECANHNMTKEELNIQTGQLTHVSLELENTKKEAAVKLEATEGKLKSEIDELKKRLADAEQRLDELETSQLEGIPPDTTKIISGLKAKLKSREEEKATLTKEKADLNSQIKTLQAKINSLEKSTKLEKTSNYAIETKLKQWKTEKDAEIQQIRGAADKKERERANTEKKKTNALEQKIRMLEAGGAVPVGRAKSAVGRGDGRAVQALQDKLRESKKEISDLQIRILQLEKDRKRVAPGAGGAGDIETSRQMKKQEKVLKEMEKIIDNEKKKNQKNDENNKKLEQELRETQKALQEKERDLLNLQTEMTVLGVSAQEAASLNKDIKKLKSDMRKLTEENKTLAENFNTERVLRKKYYNMVEDMKGKIRVYCRVRPMSKSELNRGNHSVVKSPDEYTVVVDTTRGVKEFQFDSIFMPESTQENVFEDTNNLVQSAVDGYNVCIFAYGQTGSGKTFTIIGDREQTLPGIAPRAFNKIFELLEENKSKFSYKVSCYMLELYNDKLLDLFAKTQEEDRLEIKKDKKGMVVVQGAEVKSAKNSKILYSLFEQGSKSRHTASTNMNAESSRSHLVIGITIETTNRTSGSVMQGKLSLVDLAGSERASKTGATAEQLKEAMSINKSLSALGDVISALSSEQSFIPYRNNKLTMLMQDSLGGNAKTLMFVNVSPADYNTDESAVSLTYASRVKLITNDAQKNSDNKEIARLKNVIAKMKKGEAAAEEDAD